MKVVAVLESRITDGGGFNQALNAVLQMSRLSPGNFECAVLTSHPENLPFLEKIGVSAQTFTPSLADTVVAGLSTSEPLRRLQSKLKLVGPFEKKLLSMGCNLVYFVAPTSRAASLQVLNYIATIWDDCHRDFPEFPEVRRYGEFLRREFIYGSHLAHASLIIVDSEQLRYRLHQRYGLDMHRMVVMPFAPGPLLASKEAMGFENVSAIYGLESGYFFYPAQFWPHKNHVRILEALAILRSRNSCPRVVFSGGDGGNLRWVQSMALKLGVDKQVTYLGFVPSQHMLGLYEGCRGVVFPTYFGPTNIPPLEAWQLGKPLIVANHLAEETGGAALLFDADDATSLADAIEQIEQDHDSEFVARGHARIAEIAECRSRAEAMLLKVMSQLSNRIVNFSPSF